MNNENNGCGCIVYLLLAILVLTLSLGSVYLIGTSNMPDWLKFWLLR